jgi:hypothetical protein
MRGAGRASSGGRQSQARRVAPSGAVVSISSTVPGRTTPAAGEGRASGSWSARVTSNRTGAGGESTAERSAYSHAPSGDGQRAP